MIRCRLAIILAERKLENLYPYSYTDVAKETGLNRVTVANLVNNATTRYDASVLDALCQTLNIQPGDLLECIPNGNEGPEQ